MKMSQRAEYATRAILDLALNSSAKHGCQSQEVARRTDVPKKFLDAILLDMRKAGLVASKRGRDGGHWLARDPSRLSVTSVLEAIDGPLSVTEATGRPARTPAEACLGLLWRKVDNAIRDVLDEVTIEALRQQATTDCTLDFNI